MRSSTLEEKLVLAKSPSDEPRPVKSKRSTATPAVASPLAMRRAANASFVQVKQWANSAKARTEPLGSSSRAASSSPLLPGNVARMADGALMAQPPLLVPREAQTAAEVVLCRTDHGSAAFFAFSPTRLAENGWLSLARDVAFGGKGRCCDVASAARTAPEVPGAGRNANRLLGMKDVVQKSGLFAVGTAASLPAIANSRMFSAQTTSRHASAPRR